MTLYNILLPVTTKELQQKTNISCIYFATCMLGFIHTIQHTNMYIHMILHNSAVHVHQY